MFNVQCSGLTVAISIRQSTISISDFNNESVIREFDARGQLRARVCMTKIVAHVRKAGSPRANSCAHLNGF